MGIRKASEKRFQATLEQVAALFKFRNYHALDSRGSEDGFPDCVFGREGYKLCLVVAELKMPGNEPTAAQLFWLDVFRTVTEHVYVWTPNDWQTIDRVLRLP